MTGQPIPDGLPAYRFPVDPWRLVEQEYSSKDLGTTETLFALGNGYLGMRANPEEGREAHSHGTYLNGFHETWPILHAEDAFGFAKTGQTIVNVPDAKLMKLYVDDEPLLLASADLDSYERAVDFRNGVLTRDLIWRTPSGKRVRVSSQRMVSLVHRHLAVLTLEVTLLDSPAPIVISSQLLNRQDGEDEYHVRSAALGEGKDPRRARKFGPSRPGATAPARAGQRDRAGVPVREQPDDARVRNQAPDRDVVRHRGRHRCGSPILRRPCSPCGRPPAIRSRSPNSSPITRRTACRRRSSPIDAPARWSEPNPRGTTICSSSNASGSTSSGRTRTSSCAATTVPSRLSAGTCSNSLRPRHAHRSRASPRRASPAAATTATTSGTPRSTSRHSSRTRCPRRPARSSGSGGGCSTPRASAPSR